MGRKRLVIIDGYSLLFRAFYGTRFLSTSSGRPTNALFGFTNMLFSLFDEIQPEALVVALDAPGKTFRHAEYPEYKGTRRETPPELVEQLIGSRELIKAFKVPVIEVTGYEADDIVGTISKLAEENGYDTTIITGDLDILQLVDEAVTVMTPQNGGKPHRIYTPEGVVERYGFGPEHVIDYKAMAGDSSDNIPGVPGIGDKSATALIQKFGSVESILENIEEVEPKYRRKIEPNIESMKMSKMLATIVRDVPLSYDFAPYSLSGDDMEEARKMLGSLEFRTHAKRLDAVIGRYVEGGASAHVEIVSESIEAHLVDGLLGFDELVKWAGDRPYSVVTVQPEDQPDLFDEAAEEAYIAIGHDVRKASSVDASRLFLIDPSKAGGHDVKSFYKSSASSLVPPRFDSMLAGYVLQSDRATYDLGDLIQGHLDVPTPEKPEETAVALGLMEKAMREKLKAQGQESVLNDIELPLVPVLAEMEQFGIELNKEFLGEYSDQLSVQIETVKSTIYELAGEEFNIGSPKQIGGILFDKMSLPGGKKTKTGWATGAEILEDLAAEHEIASEILNYRELSKLKSTYSDALPKMVASDGRVHTSFNQAVAATGRLSSNDPNLQNIPIRTELGRQIRKAFVAGSGTVLASFDYSQIELRVLAHMCKDEALVGAFQSHEDVHTTTASLMFHVSMEDVTREQRGQAKLLNFAVLYGVSDYGLARQLGKEFSVSEARELILQYNERFPAVKAFTDGLVEEAKAKGFTATLLGRRRYFPEIHAGNFNRRNYAERQAMNAPIQGTAADMIKIAMLKVRESLSGSAVKMLLQVHDELVFEVPVGGESVFPVLRDSMQDAYPLDVPVEVDGKSGLNWLEMSPV